MTTSPAKSLNTHPKFTSTLKWVAYITSSLLFALWGFIFIQRVSLMFQTYSLSDIPSLVWLVQFLHLALLVGYLLVFKRPLIGGILLTISGIVFFSFTGGDNTILYTFISLIPVFVLFIKWWLERK